MRGLGNLKLYLFIICLFGFGFLLQSQETFIDNFSTEDYSRNDGTLNFADDWDEFGDNDDPSSGTIEITGGELEFNNIDGDRIERPLDLSSSISVILTLDFDGSSRGNERLLVQLWNDNTSSFETVYTIDSNTSTGSITHILTADQISANSAIRFRGADSNWGGGEIILVDNVQFNATLLAPNDPPVLLATGNQTYCIGTSQPIVETVSITDTDDTTTSSVFIQVSNGYVNGEDLLTLTGSHPNITASWDAVQGELSLTGPALYTEFEAAVSDVEFSSSSLNPSGIRQFSITVGEANYLPPTGHYYEFVSMPGITWTAARDAAALSNYYGLQGYLATLTTQVEADFSGSQTTGVGWIGASDAATEGDWQWVTGPEAGTSFWSGGVGGTELTFAFWNNNEPNDYPDGPTTPGEENYAHITDPSVTTQPGSWNDLPNAGGGGAYAPQGYVVEYGGTIGDPVLSITATTTLNMDTEDPTASDPAGVTVYCNSDIPAADINVVLDEADNCTVNPTVSFISDVSNGGSNPELITRTYRVSDAAGNTTDVTQIITVLDVTIDTPPGAQTVFVNDNGIFTAATTNADTYQWQVSIDGGTLFTDISDGLEYSGSNTNTLTVIGTTLIKNGYLYRVLASNSSGSCPEITSASALLTVGLRSVITNRRITYRVDKS